MADRFCLCSYKFIVDDPITLSSTIITFVVSAAIIAGGILLNYGVWNKLRIEKRQTPVWRRGNLIEPIMSCFSLLQMIFWPYDLLYLWINTNEVIPADNIPAWMCNLLLSVFKTGRICIAYNSLFVAFVRYFYIVHWKKANQWDFERGAKVLRWTSIGIPLVMEIIGAFSVEYPYAHLENAKNCLTSYDNSSDIQNEEDLKPAGVQLTLQYLPQSLVTAISYIYIIITGLVLGNVTETFLYMKIFYCMKRYQQLIG